MKLLGKIIVVLAAALACGCEGGEPIEPPEYDAFIAIGGASAAGEGFTELADGDEVELIPGSQGGFHVWIGMEVLGAEGRLRIEREARRVDDEALVLRASTQTLEVPSDAMIDWWRKPNALPSFMCPSPIGVKVFDTEVDFVVQLTDNDGEILAEDRITLIPRCPEGELEFCEQICSG
ncbi:MAG: hypothetical protein KJO07_07100 [Deltaproteobacteria bacterium]|nr:hypothetical protein [Deltaproteobacteria bacterium]